MRLCTYLSIVLVSSSILVEITLPVAYCAKPPIVSKKSKLCGNEQCEEVLFKTRVKRVMGSNHEAFLTLTEGALIDVTAVKFSDRTDLMEGRLSDGRRGNFYVGAIDIGPYVEFLRNAIATRKEMKEISQDRVDVGSKKVLGSIRADLYLVRDYNVQARTYAKEQNVPEPELLPVPEVSVDSHQGHIHAHGHSHEASNHDHSHSRSTSEQHGRNHGTPNADHGHSHSTFNSDHGHSHDLSSQDHGDSHDGHFHEDALISHVHNTNIKVDAGQESKGTSIDNDLSQGSSEDKTRQISYESDPIKTTGQSGAVYIKDATLQETSPQKKNIKAVTDEERLKVDSHLPLATPAPATATIETNNPDVKLTLPSGENGISENGVVPATTQTVPTVPLDIIASHVIKEEKPSQHLDLPPLVPSASSPQSVDTQAVPQSVDLTVNDARPDTGHPPAKSKVTTSETEAASNRFPIDSVMKESSVLPSTSANITSSEEVVLTAHDEAANSFLKEKHIDSDAIQAAGFSEEALMSAPLSSSSLEAEYCAREECPSEDGVHSAESNGQSTFESQGETESVVHQAPSSVAGDTSQHTLTEHPSLCGGPIGGFLKSFFSSVRAKVPLSGIDGAGIGLVLNIVFLLVFIVIHFTSYFLSDFSESKLFDRMIIHDLATNCKFLEEQTKMKEVELNRARSAASQSKREDSSKSELEDEICRKNVEIQELFRNGESMKAEMVQLERLLQSMKAEVIAERNAKDSANRCAEEYKHRLEDSERVYSNVTSEFSSMQKMQKLLEENLDDERRSHAEAATKLKEAKEDLRRLRAELDVSRNEKEKLKLEKNNLELENTTLSAMIEEMDKNRKEGSAGESGGSGGWSDFGEDFGEADVDKEKTPASSTVTLPAAVIASDVREAAKLRAQLKKSEQEMETVRTALYHETEQRQQLTLKLNALENEVEKKSKEVEAHDRERSRADERCHELLSIMKENTLVIREAELLRDKLQENLLRQQAELASLIQEKRTKEDRIQELEVELKRVRNEHLKLETKRFNEVLDLKHRLDAMQTDHQLTNPVAGYEALNQSVSSSDRETILPPALLWEETPRSVSRTCATSPEDEFLLETLPIPKRGSMRGRRSDRLARDRSSFEIEKRREKKESSHRRVRSRSHGRQLWGSGMLDQQQLYPERSGSSHEHSRSSHTHYSSGGSNEGRSPPPEIPLLSAVPPSGVKKPMGKRVIDADFDIKSS